MNLGIFMLILAVLFVVVPLLVSFYAMFSSEQVLDRPVPTARIAINLYGLNMLLLVGLIFAALDGDSATSLSLGCLLLFIPYAALFGLLFAYHRPHWLKIGIVAVIVIFPLAIRPVDWGMYKPFLRRLDRVKTDMTIEQVETIMAGFNATPGSRFSTPVCPAPGGSLPIGECARYYAPQPNLDRAIVTFREGRVVWVFYDND